MHVLPRNVLYYGTNEPLPDQKELRAGPVSLVYEAGGLRHISLGTREIVRRVYVAVRDHHWSTVPAKLFNVRLEAGDASFCVTYDAAHRQGDIDFFWQGTITGDWEGTITFSMQGVARSTFLRNRIGFCVLHPIEECADQPCIVEHVDGALEQGKFPKYISPLQPFLDMRAIAHEVVPGLWAEVRFAGDVFEMEDQRNWTDASYKTYSTPLRSPFPVTVQAGTTIRQSVTLTLKGNVPALPADTHSRTLTCFVGETAIGSLPRIGLGIASHGRPLSEQEVARLKVLNVAHLRVELHLAQREYPSLLRRANAEAQALGVPLEIALILSDDTPEQLQLLVSVLEQLRPAVSAWLVFHANEKSTSEHWINCARTYLRRYQPGARIGGGTNLYFAQLNRNRPSIHALDLVSYSINPQVHAFDNASLVETLSVQAATVESARQWSGGLPVVVSPITLKSRANPDTSGPEPEPTPGEAPTQVDIRQMSLFGAIWTAVSLKYLAESGVTSMTYYETSGWRGVMETEQGSPLPERFRSLPGSVFPLYHALADVGEFVSGEIVPVTSSDSLRVDGLALRKGQRTSVIIANMWAEPQRVMVQNLSAWVRVRYLDETTAYEAMLSPETFRAQAGTPLQTTAGALELSLLPYAIARINNEGDRT